jgi:hypothetical protein
MTLPIRESGMSLLGQKRRFDHLPFTSGLPLSMDIDGVCRHVAKCHNRTHAAQQKLRYYSITSSARATNAAGISRPSALWSSG